MLATAPDVVQHLEHQKLILELDRQGLGEYVNYGYELPFEVTDYLESFGFTEAMGSYSDIADIEDVTGTPTANLSIGYYHQHSANEYLHVPSYMFTVARVKQILKAPIAERYEVEVRDTYDDGWGQDYSTAFKAGSREYPDIPYYCDSCQMPFEDCACGAIYNDYVKHLSVHEKEELMFTLAYGPLYDALYNEIGSSAWAKACDF